MAKMKRPPHTPPKTAKEETSSRRGGGDKKPFSNTNRGALFQNDKDGNEKRPDMTGIIDIQIPEDVTPGQVVKFRLAGWERQDRNDNTYLSLNIQKADKQGSNRKSKDEDSDD